MLRVATHFSASRAPPDLPGRLQRWPVPQRGIAAAPKRARSGPPERRREPRDHAVQPGASPRQRETTEGTREDPNLARSRRAAPVRRVAAPGIVFTVIYKL